jgi:hypothetical protein
MSVFRVFVGTFIVLIATVYFHGVKNAKEARRSYEERRMSYYQKDYMEEKFPRGGGARIVTYPKLKHKTTFIKLTAVVAPVTPTPRKVASTPIARKIEIVQTERPKARWDYRYPTHYNAK